MNNWTDCQIGQIYLFIPIPGCFLREARVRGDPRQRDGRVGQPGAVPHPPGRQADQAGGGPLQEELQPRGREVLQAVPRHRQMLQERILLLR